MRFDDRRLPAALLLVMLLLSACSTLQKPLTGDLERTRLYNSRRTALEGIHSWSLEGRLAVRNGKDGGSGTFHWRNSIGGSRMDFHGAFGRGAWRLLANATGATLEFADGTLYRAPTVSQLARSQLGWSIPVESLSWWVRGLAAPGGYRRRELDEHGNLAVLVQRDWTIEFGRYRPVDEIDLPVMLTARQADRVVKLAVRKWQLGSEPKGL